MPAYAKASHMYNNKVLAEALEVAHLKSIIAMELSAGQKKITLRYQVYLGPSQMCPLQACNRQTAYCVPLYDTLGPDAVEYIIGHAEVTIVFASALKMRALVEPLTRAKGKVKAVIVWGEIDGIAKTVSTPATFSEQDCIISGADIDRDAKDASAPACIYVCRFDTACGDYILRTRRRRDSWASFLSINCEAAPMSCILVQSMPF